MAILEDGSDDLKTPLVVDIDGTLLDTDLLMESFFALLSAAPLTALRGLAV